MKLAPENIDHCDEVQCGFALGMGTNGWVGDRLPPSFTRSDKEYIESLGLAPISWSSLERN